jgi:hypothetical protein
LREPRLTANITRFPIPGIRRFLNQVKETTRQDKCRGLLGNRIEFRPGMLAARRHHYRDRLTGIVRSKDVAAEIDAKSGAPSW